MLRRILGFLGNVWGYIKTFKIKTKNKMKTINQSQIPLDSKKKGKVFAGIIIVMTISFLGLSAVSSVSAEDAYMSDTLTLEAAYTASGKTHCYNHKHLAKSKLKDELHGAASFSDEKRNELHQVANQDCENWGK